MALPTTMDQTQAEETLGIIQNTLKNFSWTQAAVISAMLVTCVVAIRILVGWPTGRWPGPKWTPASAPSSAPV